VSELDGAGAAGGLAGGLAAVGAVIDSGFDVVADEVDLGDRIEVAQLVITGEGFLDAESFEGKVVGGVADLATDLGIPSLAVVGQIFDGMDQRIPAISLVRRFGEDRAMHDTLACIEEAVAEHLASSNP
jgi:glycerate kinase